MGMIGNFPAVGIVSSANLADKAVTAPKLDTTASQLFGFRNRIINGDMRIDQRNNGASVTPTTDGQFLVDRFKFRLSQASKFSAQRNADSISPPPGFSTYLGFTSLSAYSVSASDFFAVGHNIEGLNIADWSFGTSAASPITLSFWVRSTLTGQFSGVVFNNGNTRNYNFIYTINAANTWEYKTITIPGDTGGTWLTDTNNGLLLLWSLGAGSTLTGAAQSWSATNYVAVSGSVNLVGTNGAKFYITGVQLEKGTVATPFEFRSIGQELALCQRYYQILSTAGWRGYVSNVVREPRIMPVVMRSTPTLVKNAVGASNLQTDLTAALTNASWGIDLQFTGGGVGVIDITDYVVIAVAEL